MFAKLTVRFERARRESASSVSNLVPSEKLPPLLAAAAERGVRSGLQSGEIGYPVMDVHATIIDAQVDPVLSREEAFEFAGADAVQKALRGNIILLEPIMRVEVQVPDEFFGPISADLSARGAQILRTDQRNRWWIIEALVPLAKMFDYAEQARSLSQGRASSTMEPHSYAAAPREVLESMLNPL
jgi:elongation factor G